MTSATHDQAAGGSRQVLRRCLHYLLDRSTDLSLYVCQLVLVSTNGLRELPQGGFENHHKQLLRHNIIFLEARTQGRCYLLFEIILVHNCMERDNWLFIICYSFITTVGLENTWLIPA